MPRRRRIDAEHPAYDPGACGPDGHAQCRRCLGDVRRPRSQFCSDACEHDFRIRASPAYARQAVYRRDRGVCTHCRLDCGLLDRIVARLRHPLAAAERAGDDGDGGTAHSVDEEGERSALWLIEALGMGRRKRACSLWQADHRVAFSTGGADCGLGNLRTLCLACHQAQTRALHHGQKAARRGSVAVG